MDERTLLFEELEGLLKELRYVFSSLESQLSSIEERFHGAELEFMYGNIGENSYKEKLKQVCQDIASFKQKLLLLQDIR